MSLIVSILETCEAKVIASFVPARILTIPFEADKLVLTKTSSPAILPIEPSLKVLSPTFAQETNSFEHNNSASISGLITTQGFFPVS